MVAKLQVLKLHNNSGISQKNGKPYSIDELRCVDMDCPEEVLSIKVHKDMLDSVTALVGKTVNVMFSYRSGNFQFVKAA